MTAIFCPVDDGPRVVQVDGSMRALRDLVSGYVEMVHVLPGIMAAINEHYIELGLPVNRWIHRVAYNGGVVFVGSPRRGVPYRDLMPDDMYALCEAGYLDANEFMEENEHGNSGV